MEQGCVADVSEKHAASIIRAEMSYVLTKQRATCESSVAG